VYITKDGAEALVERGIAAVGIDYLSVDSIEDHVVHHTLMRHDIFVFEGLQFKDVEPGNYTLLAFPLKIQGGDGSCVRAVLQLEI
jgi:arylformamidase